MLLALIHIHCIIFTCSHVCYGVYNNIIYVCISTQPWQWTGLTLKLLLILPFHKHISHTHLPFGADLPASFPTQPLATTVYLSKFHLFRNIFFSWICGSPVEGGTQLVGMVCLCSTWLLRALPELENPRWSQFHAWRLGAGFWLGCVLNVPLYGFSYEVSSTWRLISCSRAWITVHARSRCQESKNGSGHVSFDLGPELA